MLSNSDLAAECDVEHTQAGVRVIKGEGNGCPILRVQIKSQEAAARLGKPMGQYVSVEFDSVWLMGEQERARVSRAVGVELRSMAEKMCGERAISGLSVLVVGLGNREITADAVGPQTVRALTVSRPREGKGSLTAFLPGVPAETGLQTVEVVRGLARELMPDLILAVDALAARAPDKLGATVQLADSGVQPGSGLGRRSCTLSLETVGVPVLAVGMPTVVRTDALIREALCRAGVPELADAVAEQCLGRVGYVVSPAEIDLAVLFGGELLARAIERAFLAITP